MNAVVFDTLRLAKRLEASGMSQPQGVDAALSETLSEISVPNAT